MKKAGILALALVMALSLVSCGNSDADRSDNTKDGVIGDGLDGMGDDLKKAGDDIRDAVDDVTGMDRDDNTGTGSGTNGNGTTGNGAMGSGTTGNGAMGSGSNGMNGSARTGGVGTGMTR